MKIYHIVYSEQADEDLNSLYDVIVSEYKAPLTAFRYVEGVIETIENLSIFPEAYPVRYNLSLSRYGTKFAE